MKRKNWVRLLSLAATAVLTLSFAGCAEEIPYNDYLDAADGYDKELFYCNTGAVQAADPSVITVGDTFYLFATNANTDTDCSYICGWSSKNLSDWESLGAVFVPARDAWAVNSLWAPEVIEKDGKYYMYYSGYDYVEKRMGIGLAVADAPNGPYHEIEGTFNGKTYSRTQKPFDFGCPAIDASPFIDDDGSVYLYFSQDQVSYESSIYGCKLESDMVTVVEGSLTESALVRATQSWESVESSRRWNEAPFMIKHNGKYILSYSGNYYQSNAYAVGLAVSDSPLGTFRKVDYNPVLIADPDLSLVSGTGHNSFFRSPDGTELWIAYHSHIDVMSGGSERKINFDRVQFDGDKLIVCGPSVTPQVLPSGCSEYGNIAGDAEISVSSVSEGAELLVDGLIGYRYNEAELYELALEKKTTVTFTFAEEVTVKAIMVYDSVDYALSAEKVDVAFDTAKIGSLQFNPAYRYEDETDGFEIKYPGSAAIAEFEEIRTKTVTFTFSGGIALNEIVILGK